MEALAVDQRNGARKVITAATRASKVCPGTRFGQVVVTAVERKHRLYAHCRCDCGRTFLSQASNLTTGNTTTCGGTIHRVQNLTGTVRGAIEVLHDDFPYGDLTIRCRRCGAEYREKRKSYREKVRSYCRECRRDTATSHGAHTTVEGTRLYRRWVQAKHRFGVVHEWEDFGRFREDTAAMFDATKNMTRIDDNAPLGPDNIVWLSRPDLIKRSWDRRKQ